MKKYFFVELNDEVQQKVMETAKKENWFLPRDWYKPILEKYKQKFALMGVNVNYINFDIDEKYCNINIYDLDVDAIQKIFINKMNKFMMGEFFTNTEFSHSWDTVFVKYTPYSLYAHLDKYNEYFAKTIEKAINNNIKNFCERCLKELTNYYDDFNSYDFIYDALNACEAIFDENGNKTEE